MASATENYQTSSSGTNWMPMEEFDVLVLASCHIADAKLDILCKRFQDRVMSSPGDVSGPSRSYDLTPLDLCCGVSSSRTKLKSIRLFQLHT